MFTYTNKSMMVVNIAKLFCVAIGANHAVCENITAMFVGKIKDPF